MKKRNLACVLFAGLVALGLFSVNPAMAAPGQDISELTPVTGEGAGIVAVATTAADQGTFAAEINVSVHQTAAETTFNLERRFSQDCVNFGPYAPVLGGEPFTTSAGGAGSGHYSPSTSVPSGTTLGVQLRAISLDSSIQLESACMVLTAK